MNRPYGPWATLITAGQNPQLSAFWRRRMEMLVPVSQTSPSISRRQMLMLTGVAAATAALPTLRVAAAEAEPPKDADDALKKTLAAWEKRRASLKSFHYECDFTESNQASTTVQEGDPFGAAVDKKTQTTGTFTLSCAGEKVAWIEERDERGSSPDKRQTTKYRHSFDGVHYQVFIDTRGRPWPSGRVASATMLDKRFAQNPDDVEGRDLQDLARKYVKQTALEMWFSPLLLLKYRAYPPDGMQVRRLHVLHSGHDCVEAAIPCKAPQLSWEWPIVLYIDPARDYVPVGYVQQHAGVTKRDIEIQFAREEDGTWRVSAWDEKHFDESGKLRQTSSFQVKRCLINKPIHDEVFTPEFPKGTHVVDHDLDAGDPRKYFVSMGRGVRRYIQGPPPAPPAP